MEQNTYFDQEKAKFLAYMETNEYKDKLTKRAQINLACAKDPYSVLAAIELSKKDPIFFINNFGWTFDPRPEHEPHNIPFILYPYQEDAIRKIIDHIEHGKDLYIDKSRDMGVSWLIVYSLYWCWRFQDGFSGTIGSRKEDLVDNRTKDSLFGMLDYAMENTPDFMMPKRFNPKKHRLHMKIINPESMNLIAGESMNPNFSRGSRKKVVFFDELAFWEYAKEAWESAGDTTPCRIGVTTPAGYNFAAMLKESGVDTLSLHWTLHPLKDNIWYEHQKSRRTEEEVAQELDISYHKSQAGRVYPEWGDIKREKFEYDPELPLYCSWDFGQTDDTAMVWWQEGALGQVKLLDSYANHGKTIDFYVPFVTGDIPSDGYKYTKKDLECINSHKGWKKGIHYGDPAGRFTNQVVNKSVIDVLQSYGIYVNFREEAKDFATRKTATKLLLRNIVMNDNDRNKYLSMCMENAAYPKVRDAGSDAVRSIKPKHDWTSHFRSAVEYFAVNYGQNSRRVKVMDKFGANRFNGKKLIGY